MITLENDRLVFRFPELHAHAVGALEFQRTLRIPDDGRTYPLPPGLGRFPLRHLDDHAAALPEAWRRRGGVIMPVFQSEAMWISFERGRYPFAIRIATGRIDAVSGEDWRDGLHRDPQDYVVLPVQPWLDGYCVGRGVIRQFVAMPLGTGYSVEEQLTGSADTGGVQITVHPMKAERYRALIEARDDVRLLKAGFDGLMPAAAPAGAAMGLAPGGRMTQDIYDDPYELSDWDCDHVGRCFVTLLNSLGWVGLTGELPPTRPPGAAEYSRHGLPWYEYYGGDAAALAGSERLRGARSVAELGRERRDAPLPENESAEIARIVKLRAQGVNVVRESEF